MHILNVMLSSGGGGIESAFADYAAMLAAGGHSVTCCTVRDAFILKHLPAGVGHEVLANRSQFDPLAVWHAGKLLKRVKPQVVITHGKRAFQIFALARQLFARKVKLVNVLHRHRYKDLQAADLIITVSRAIRDEAMAYGIPEKKLVHIPNAILQIPQAVPAAFRTPPVVGVLGRLVPEKGVDIFLSALALLKKKNISCRARIAGEGEIKDTLQRQADWLGIQDSVEWLGWVEDVPAFYNSIDVYCQPSRAESFGLALLGAMAQAKPVVSTRTLGPSEYLAHEKNAMLSDFTPESLADALEDMMVAPARAMQLALAARETAQGYGADKVGRQLSECLQQLTT